MMNLICTNYYRGGVRLPRRVLLAMTEGGINKMFIDSHCHITDEKFPDIAAVIERAKLVGVSKLIMPTGNLADAKKAIDAAEKYRQFAMVGIHPEEVENLYRFPIRSGMTEVEMMNTSIEELRKLALSSKTVVGVGEIGLDFYFDKEKRTKEKQIELFSKQMDLAIELDLPVVIHMREAEEEMLLILKEMKELPRGQFHCFAGSTSFLRYILDRGFFVSFAGNITYKSAGNLRELLKQVPLDRLLLETDSPYLSPEPLRGTVNEPANVKIIAEYIARELDVEPDLLAETTTHNTKCLYSLDD